MSNNTDDTMRRIEEALNNLITVERERAADGAPETRVMRADFLATIRAALQPDAGGWGEDDDRFRANGEHERAVEAWKKRAVAIRGEINKDRCYVLRQDDIDEALRLMRRQPKETP